VPERLLEQGREPSPQRRDRAGSADDERLPVDEHLVASLGVSVTGHVRDAATVTSTRVGRRGVDRRLVGRHRRDAGNPATGRAPAGVRPHRLGGDLTRSGLEPGAAAADDNGTGRWEVDVRLAVRDPVAAAVVTRRGEDTDSEQCGRLERLSHGCPRCARPLILRLAPADRDDAGLVGLVVDRGEDRVGETLVGVRCEVHGDPSAGSDRPDNLHIKHHFAVGTIRVACRRVRGAIHPDGHDGRHGLPGLGEVLLEILLASATTELDDGNALTGSGRLRKLVEAGHLSGIERRSWPRKRPEATGEGVTETQVSPCRWSGVQPQHGNDPRCQVTRKSDDAAAPSKDLAVRTIDTQPDPEGPIHRGDRAAQPDRALGPVDLDDVESMIGGEPAHGGDVLWPRAEATNEIGASDVGTPTARLLGEAGHLRHHRLLWPAKVDGDGHQLARRGGSDPDRGGRGFTATAGKRDACGARCGHDVLLLRSRREDLHCAEAVSSERVRGRHRGVARTSRWRGRGVPYPAQEADDRPRSWTTCGCPDQQIEMAVDGAGLPAGVTHVATQVRPMSPHHMVELRGFEP
jgi:hypothetical protein